ncbi:MAG: alpha/beta hydrolase [Candidatus Levybacteria bacterium]|nr:alpha/beta hydrolase [Candidatus Levybacteria bacterium]
MRTETSLIPTDTSSDFAVNGRIIRVNSRTIQPDLIGPLTYDPIVIFPGWGNNANSRSAQMLGHAFAEEGKRKVIIIDTKPHEIFDNSLLTESAAVAQFLERAKTESTTIVGYSEGGIKAANLAVILQKSKIKPEGLALLGAAGLYESEQVDPMLAFARHGIQSKKRVNRTFMRPLGQSGQGIIAGQVLELKRTKFNYPRRLAYQVREISRRNPRLKEINIPIVVINGAEDLVSEPERFIPGFRRLNQYEREEALKRTIFQNSPYVRFLAGEKPPIHTMPILRARTIARVSLGLLERTKR